MTIGIYSITHVATGRRYIGKSVNIESRFYQHKSLLSKPVRSRDCNRHLYNAVQKYGWNAFSCEVLDACDWVDEDWIATRELFWMDHFNTCNRAYGFNLRRDSSTRMIVHDETKVLMSASVSGFNNPNFANSWSDEQKAAMSANRLLRADRYGDQWRKRIAAKSTAMWNDQAKRNAMGAKVSVAKRKYDFLQYDRDGNFLRRWSSIAEIVAANPDWKWQNIYSVCHGHKPTYRGFVWKQEAK